ncbi:S26 family signal peptidase [Actinomadura rupiterrae]|uniref:S26 family signal peptidase n=1 Tax=Actinomadura rupiterrae TaxID=559627 RepID=UPI0020A3DE1B|nr:S26 family signal peptidase [Actinomadura rupiterrae]MCP2343475.1 signal peptidase I [Actinomadura rupiterrae]
MRRTSLLRARRTSLACARGATSAHAQRTSPPGTRRTALACALGAVALTAGLAARAARRRLVVVTVEGRSMAPTFQDGDRVLVRRRTLADVRNGDIVVLEPPSTGEYLAAPPPGADGPARTIWNVKRVAALPGDPIPDGVPADAGTVPPGRLAVFGDNPDSIDSRQRGLYSGERLLGVVLRRLGGG